MSDGLVGFTNCWDCFRNVWKC